MALRESRFSLRTALRSPVAFAGRVPATEAILASRHAPLTIRPLTMTPEDFHEWLKENVYNGRTPAELFRWPLTGSGVCLIFFGLCGIGVNCTYMPQCRKYGRFCQPQRTGPEHRIADGNVTELAMLLNLSRPRRQGIAWGRT
jgi:hypothetical protein